MQPLIAIHDDILRSVAAAHRNLDGQKLTTFFPMKGTASTGELMVVGRAVNGWNEGWSPVEVLDPVKRAEVLDDAISKSTQTDCCPMSWVLAAWKRAEGYNSKKSAFWRVIHAVTQAQFGLSDNWSSNLIWSNLYKVAPYKGGNPSDKLCGLQQEACESHLAAEVDLWRPKRILFITGLNWAKPFLERLGKSLGEQQTGPIQWSGIIERLGCSPIRVAVTIRPERRREAPIVEAILTSLALPRTAAVLRTTI
jgi:hypothetical protein